MKIEEKNNDFVYLYKLLPGISDKKGAIKVLNDLKYPQIGTWKVPCYRFDVLHVAKYSINILQKIGKISN